jgi:hypothetical protein
VVLADESAEQVAAIDCADAWSTDRGMVTEANLAAIGEAGYAFVTALRRRR